MGVGPHKRRKNPEKYVEVFFGEKNMDEVVSLIVAGPVIEKILYLDGQAR